MDSSICIIIIVILILCLALLLAWLAAQGDSDNCIHIAIPWDCCRRLPRVKVKICGDSLFIRIRHPAEDEDEGVNHPCPEDGEDLG